MVTLRNPWERLETLIGDLMGTRLALPNDLPNDLPNGLFLQIVEISNRQ